MVEKAMLPKSQAKILQLCLSSSWGGLEMVAYEFAVNFQQAQIPVTTLGYENSSLLNRLREHSLPIVEIPTKGKGSLKTIRTLRQKIQEMQPTHIIVQRLGDLKYLAPACMGLSGFQVIGFSHTFVEYKKKDFFHSWLYSKLDTLIVLTEIHKRNLLQYLPLKESQLAIIPNWVNVDRFRSPQKINVRDFFKNTSEKDLITGVVARLDPQKGQDVTIQAIDLLKKKNIPVKLILIGENTHGEFDQESYLKKMTKDLGLENEVAFLGFRKDVPELVASMDIMIMPSKQETFGRVLIEAMAAETAIIASNKGGVPDIVKDRESGLLFESMNAKDLAGKIEELARSPELRERLVQNAVKQVDQYRTETVLGKILKVMGLG